jgi:hypothetical protein
MTCLPVVIAWHKSNLYLKNWPSFVVCLKYTLRPLKKGFPCLLFKDIRWNQLLSKPFFHLSRVVVQMLLVV